MPIIENITERNIMMKARTSLWASLAIAASLGLAGCGGSSDNDDPAPTPEVTPPEPDAATVDLGNARTATAAAATAAGTASTNAAADAKRATDATANLATLQTGETAAALAKESSDYADMAEAESMKAQAASTAAAAATTASAAGAQQNIAEAAQEAAEGHAAMAKGKADMAVAAAMMEFNFSSDGDLSIGESEVNADMAQVAKPADPADTDSKAMITGHQNFLTRDSAAVSGRPHSLAGTSPVEGYRQAVADRSLTLGRTLETTDDKARVSMYHSYSGSQEVRVYALASETDNTGNAGTFNADATPANLHVWTNTAGVRAHNNSDTPSVPSTFTAQTNAAVPTLTSIGMHYQADHPAGQTGGPENRLDANDLIDTSTAAKEVFSYTEGTTTYHVVMDGQSSEVGETSRVSYRHVDIMAPAAPDGPDNNADLELRVITADLPMAHKYSHVNFGIWAALDDAAKDGSQDMDSQGIGWIHNIDGSGMTPSVVTGEATYKGNWVAVVERRNSSSEGPFNGYHGDATLEADFEDNTLEATLAGLATLKGDLTGNAFKGATATDIAHRDLNANGTFKGSFSGGVYGADGSEAAGVFDFDGGSAGAFRGAFGGKYDD